MSDTIWSTIIVALSSIICQLLISRKGRKDREVEDAVKDERMENRLGNIEHKLDVHNGYAEKLGEIQIDIAVIKNSIKNSKGDTRDE